MNRAAYFGVPKIVSYDEAVDYVARECFDLVVPTLSGLLEDLIPGSELCNRLLLEIDKSEEKNYGEFFIYEREKHLVRFAPRFWHRLALLIRNSTLLLDLEMKLGWAEVREIFDRAVIAVAGCSVGNSAIHAAASDMRPAGLKIADSKEYHITNANRVRLTYQDFGRVKSIVTAEQIHAVDPFMPVEVFEEGIHSGNIDEFLTGVSVVIEEMDDLKMKVLIRERARKMRIPVLMVTDLGSAIQLDVRRFDVSPDLPLAACADSDKALYEALERSERDPSRKNFFDFVYAIVGRNDGSIPEYRSIINREEPQIFGGVPQLGSTGAVAGGVVAEAAARLLLGHKMSERLFIHKFYGISFEEGAVL